MKYLLLAAALLLLSSNVFAQFNCGADAADQNLRAANPTYDALRTQAESLISQVPYTSTATSPNGSSALVTGGVHYLPVVVHIIHNGEPLGSQYNPTDQQVSDYIAVLNQGLSATFPGYPGALTGGQDITIQFALAQRTPDCNPTNGIVRKNASVLLPPAKAAAYSAYGVSYNNAIFPGISYDDFAPLSNWPNQDYYNIYLVRSINGASGYAYYPPAGPTLYDAAVLTVGWVTMASQVPDLSAHEIGHAFGLYHTFNGSTATTCPPNTSCATQGDMICDTDPHLEVTNGCDPAVINPCTGQPYGNVVKNYMSYSCPTMFTADQKTRMLSVLTGVRASLDASLGATSLALVPPGPIAPSPGISISTSQSSYCTGSPVTVTAATTYAGINPVYQWKVNGMNAGTSNAVFTSTTLNNGDVISCDLTSSYSPSCVTSNFATSNSITVNILSTPAPSISITTPSDTVCYSMQVSFTATATNPGPYVPFFQWYVNGNFTGYSTGTGATTSTYTYMPNDGDEVSCLLIANPGCSPNPWPSNTITITALPSSYPEITISANDSSLCSGDTIFLSAAVIDAGINPMITWYELNTPGTIGSGAGPIPVVLTDTSAFMAQVTVTNTGGLCFLQTVSPSYWLDINVSPMLPPGIVITAWDSLFCPGEMVSLSSAVTNEGDDPAYQWMVNGIPAGGNNGVFDLTPADNDVISCELSSSYACPSPNPVISNGIMLHQRDTVEASVSFLQGTNAVCEGDTIVLAAGWINLDTNTIAGRQWLVNGITAGTTDTLTYVLSAGANDIEYSTNFQYTPPCMSGNLVHWYTTTITASPQSPVPVVTDLGTHFSSNYPNGQNQWHAVGVGPLAGEVNQLFYPAFSGSFYDIVNVNGCPGKPSDTLIFNTTTVVNAMPAPAPEFHPNPSATGVFETPQVLMGREVVVTDGTGRVVLKTRLEKRLALAGCAPGVYFVCVPDGSYPHGFKLVVGR